MALLKRLPYRPMVIVLAFYMLIFPFVFRRQYQLADAAFSYYDDGQTVDVRGIVYKKEVKNNSCKIYLKNLYISKTSFPGRAILVAESDEFPLGSKLHIYGRTASFSIAENEGSFDEKNYALGQGIFLRVELLKIYSCKTSKVSAFLEFMYQLKKSLKEFYELCLPGEESGLLAAMTLGDKNSLDEEVKTLFSHAGLSHILAISGLHISIVGMGLYGFLRKRGLPFGVSGSLSFLAVILYCFITGFGVSSLRASIMFGVFMLGQVLGEKYDMLSSFSLALMLVLSIQPLSFVNSGFVFSFGAIFGIIAVANPMMNSYEKRCKKRFEHTLRYRKGMNYRKSLKEKLVTSILFSLGVQLFTLPMVAYFYYRVPVYVVGLNVIMLPILGAVIGCGLLGGLIGVLGSTLLSSSYVLVTCLGWILSNMGRLFLCLCHVVLYFYEQCSDLSLQLPFAQVVTGKPSVWKIIIYYIVLFSFVWGRQVVLFLKNKLEREGFWNPRHYVGASFLIGVFCMFLLSFHLGRPCEIDMLSVGQGDGIFICSKEGVVFFVDGGSSSKKELGKYVLEPFLLYHGVNEVDYWMLSHMDSDHISGCMELLESGFGIKNLVLTSTVKTEEDETAKSHYKSLVELCEKNHTRIIYIEEGGKLGTKSLSFTCLAPKQPSDFEGTNENSMMLKMSYGKFDMIFTGDVGSEQEKRLLETYVNEKNSAFVDIEVLKSAHHGSKNSNSRLWLETLQPKLCVISAGKNNLYGHPSKETLERMEQEGIYYLCTIDSGQIKLQPQKDGDFTLDIFLDEMEKN